MASTDSSNTLCGHNPPAAVCEMYSGFRQIFWPLLCLQAAYFAVVVISLLLLADMDWEAYSNYMHWPKTGGTQMGIHFATWDAAHYLHLAQTGYLKGDPSTAFYPLWPLLIRCFASITGGNYIAVGLVLANVFSLLAFAMFFRLAANRCGWVVARLSLLLLITFPGSLFFHFVYTESLFLLLLMLFCDGLERRSYAPVLVAALLLPLTKAVGIFCIFPLILHLVVREPPTWLTKLRQPGRQRSRTELTPPLNLDPLNQASGASDGLLQPVASAVTRPQQGQGLLWLLPLAPLLGWSVYFGLMWISTGNAFEGFEAQKHWNNIQSISNIFDVPKFVSALFTPNSWHDYTGSLLDRSVFVLLLACLPILWRLDKGWFLWCVILGVVPAMSGTFTSFTRFATVVFPVFIALAVVLETHSMRYRRGAVILFSFLHISLLWRFLNFRWAG